MTELLGDARLVIDCTDNAEARRLIQSFVRARDLPCLHGALSADGGFARVVWDEYFVLDQESTAGEATCEDGAQLPFFAMAAATLASSAQAFLQASARASYQLTPGNLVRIA